MREATVSDGVAELESGADLDIGLVPALLVLVEPDERGDPMCWCLWKCVHEWTPSWRDAAPIFSAWAE
jgi:hypothetical protein